MIISKTPKPLKLLTIRKILSKEKFFVGFIKIIKCSEIFFNQLTGLFREYSWAPISFLRHLPLNLKSLLIARADNSQTRFAWPGFFKMMFLLLV
jgi:hypothetical protein